jgi:biotin transport system substrate-specific component
MADPSPARPLAAAALVAAVTAVGALIAIPNPFTPGVPFTLQLVGVLLAGPLLGPAWGAASQAVYLLLGAAGLPVFAGGGGIGELFSVTGGFLWSYPVAAFLMGMVAGRRRASAGRYAVAVVAGIAAIYGLGWLGMHAFGGVPLTPKTGLALLTFLPADVLKGLVAAALARRLRR